jgi:hypothetical protein
VTAEDRTPNSSPMIEHRQFLTFSLGDGCMIIILNVEELMPDDHRR